MTTEPRDEDLVGRALAGDAEAFGRLVARHYDTIFRVAFRVTGRRAEAEDLAQDVCVALPGKLARFRGEARFTTWLYRVTVNAARDRLREAAARDRAAAGWGEVEVMNRATAAEKAGDNAWLAEAMNGLAPDLRETVALVLGEEMTHGQAAEVLEISEGTVSWRMSEVRRILRERAKEEERAI